MDRGTPVLIFFIFCAVGQALTPTTYLTTADKDRLRDVIIRALPFAELATIHYSVLGSSILGVKIPNAQDLCKQIKDKADPKSLESLYYAATASKTLGNCQVSLSGARQTLEGAIKDEASIQDLFYAVHGLKNLGHTVESAKVSKIMTAALKKDDSVLNLGYAFHVASQLQGDMNSFFERIEDVIVQADEIDGKHLQFEGGLSITATIMSGVYRLADAIKKVPTVTGEQAVKFTNYFLSRKFVQTAKGAAQLLDILKLLTVNKYHIPVAVTVASNSALSTDSPVIRVRVTNVLGDSLGPLTVTADTATRLGDSAVIMSKKAFVPVQGDNTAYSLNFMESKPLRGFYKVSVSAVPVKPDSRLVGNTGASINVKVMTKVGIEKVEVGTVDRDQATSPKATKLEQGKKLVAPLEADYHQKLVMKFTLQDMNAGTTMTSHQAFVQLLNKQTKQEIVFVAEPDSSNVYKFDVDLNNKAKDFGYMSGDYELNLIVGDSVIANPVKWYMGDLKVTFPPNPNPSKPSQNPYAPKPEIHHVFREQEKRPSPTVSNTFSVLVVVPFLLLIILWLRIGINFSNFPCSLSSFGFHLGLGGIFGLFGLFWFQLDMFTTLKLLAVLGTFTFLTGHGLLSYLAASKK
ncbi:oligosaccharide transferase delta subunit [Tachypleus tridentatus]|uniref:oligosaccharide transferase delta subunit n=1 Tax=Tachypleus tridentatus TaxID=6853 RepID=UPI003FCF70CB